MCDNPKTCLSWKNAICGDDWLKWAERNRSGPTVGSPVAIKHIDGGDKGDLIEETHEDTSESSMEDSAAVGQRNSASGKQRSLLTQRENIEEHGRMTSLEETLVGKRCR